MYISRENSNYKKYKVAFKITNQSAITLLSKKLRKNQNKWNGLLFTFLILLKISPSKKLRENSSHRFLIS